PHIIEKTLPPGPVQPRQIIIERLPTPPPKPRTVIFEKWLPYKKVKRPVLLQKAQPPAPVKPVRNVIIEYEPLKAFTVRRVIEEGVFRVDPHTYITQQPQSGIGDVRIVERIEDLPPPSEQLMRVLDDYNHDHSSQRNYHNNTTTHSPIPHSYNQFHEQEVKPQGLSSTLANLFGGRSNPVQPNTSQGPLGSNLADVSRASNIPANRQERVLSGYNSSIPSPTVIPLGKKSYHREHSNSVIHDKFIIIDFNDKNPQLFTGSSNLAAGGEEQNNDNLLAFTDPNVAQLYAVEAIRLVDHYHFRAVLQNSSETSPVMLRRDDWCQSYYDPRNFKCQERILLAK
ncbi:unnamed protein product, partial [Didymodactylos carnosus]